jgi:ethanolamine transporter EutH
MKLTVPVGVPAPGLVAVTVAVKVTADPIDEGFGVVVRAVEVSAWVGVTVIAGLESLVPKVELP